MNDPIQILKMMMGKTSPQEMVMNMIGNNNPMVNNLINMAKNGNNQGIESFARNICKERGMDFDKEFQDFMRNFK